MRLLCLSLSLKGRLLLIALLVLLAVSALAGSSAYFASRTRAAAHLLLEDGIVGSNLANRLELALQEHRGLIRSAPAELDRARLAAARRALAVIDEQILAAIAYDPITSDERSTSFGALAEMLRRELPAMFDAGQRVLHLANNFVQDQALEVSQGPYTAISDRILDEISKWRDQQSRNMNNEVDRLFANSNIMVSWVYGSAGAALLSGSVGILVALGGLRRLEKIQGVMLRLADRDHTVEVPSLTDVDEIGAMARAVQVFKRNALHIFAHEAELRRANLRLESALSNMSQGLCQYDPEGQLDIVNQRFCEIYGLDPDRIRPGLSYSEVLQCSIDAGNHPTRSIEELIADTRSLVDRREPAVALQELGDGRWVAISHRPMSDGAWVATYEDITARRAAEAQVVHMARYDALTALANRLVLNEAIEQAIAEGGRGMGSALLCLDIDHFKAVNDTFGHPVGDALLCAVAERLLACVHDGDIVARLGGDEFAIVQAGIARPEEAKLLAERVISAIEVPFLIEGHQIIVGMSMGLTLVPGDGTSSDTFLKNADMALQRAKLSGRGSFHFFEPGMDARLQNRRQLELDLRNALVAEEFELFYQPLVDLDHDEVSGFEALLRWHHPKRGMVSPAEFIPIAEDIGLIIPIGEWVIQRACADAVAWPGRVKVAVNLSAVQFKSENLVPTVAKALATSGLSAQRLELEITESVLLQDNESTLGILHQLRGLGTRISMDDFGTGYSSLSYLRRFPFDKVKIDQSFVRDIDTRDASVHIVRAIQGLCAGLGMATTAEGVETEDQLVKLRAEGCTEVQGFLFSRPRPGREVAAMIHRVSQRKHVGDTRANRQTSAYRSPACEDVVA